jgi:hypothetical protein
MLKFVSSDAESFGQKRKQVSRACEDCRRKKRRCTHAVPSQEVGKPVLPRPLLSSGTLSSPKPVSDTRRKGSERHDGTHSGALPSNSRTTSGRTDGAEAEAGDYNRSRDDVDTPASRDEPNTLDSRFIGHLNPEGMLRAAVSLEEGPDALSSNGVGTWLAAATNKQVGQENGPAASSSLAANVFYGSSSVVYKALTPILEKECLSQLPPMDDWNALSSLYFDRIHTILPIIDRTSFQNMNASDPGKILLQQGICLIASMNFDSSQHLKLCTTENLLTHNGFGKRLFAAMRTSIAFGLVSSKIILIQALALMSLFNDGPDGADIATQLSGRAIQHLHSLGLHMDGRRNEQTDHYSTTLLCCIWAIDRLNAAFHGKPVLMHERDIGRDLEACFAQQAPGFCLLIRTVALLDRVIDTYRPRSDNDKSSLDDCFPAFEDLIMQYTATNLPARILGIWMTHFFTITLSPPAFSVPKRAECLQASQLTNVKQLRSKLYTTL